MIEINDKSRCCGCHACYNICPKKAIRMEIDEKGFKYPKIDKEKCISCGLCEKACPIINTKNNSYKKSVYAVVSRDEIERKNSSSGGVFSLLAREILKRNGVVFGAAFDKNYNIKHIYIENEKELLKLRGSKYVQSDINNSYRVVQKFLNEDRYILFTGTSCQIEGLKNYLKKDYKKLYTQDIICHGVPSPKVWQKYLEYQKTLNNESIKNIDFRNKDNGWALFNLKILFDTKSYCTPNYKDAYMKAFLKNSCLRDSCYNCSFKNNYRNSDITLADYWGIGKVHPNFSDNKGVSAVIINSKKGKELFELIKNNCIYEKSNIENIYKYNPAYIKSSVKDKKYPKLFDSIDKYRFDIAVKKSVSHQGLVFKAIKFIKKVIKKIIKYQ